MGRLRDLLRERREALKQRHGRWWYLVALVLGALWLFDQANRVEFAAQHKTGFAKAAADAMNAVLRLPTWLAPALFLLSLVALWWFSRPAAESVPAADQPAVPAASPRDVEVRVRLDDRSLFITPWRGQGPVTENCSVQVIDGDAEYEGTFKIDSVVFPEDFLTTDGAKTPAPQLHHGPYRILVRSDKFRMWQDPQGYVKAESVEEPPLASVEYEVTEDDLRESTDEWNSTVKFVVPTERFPLPHKIILELSQREGKRAAGAIRCEVRFEDHVFEAPEERVIFETSNLEEGESPHYYVFFPDGFRTAPDLLSDGEYELRWYERHAMGYRLRHQPQPFHILNGEIVKRTG